MTLFSRLLVILFFLAGYIRANESLLDEVVHAPRDGEILLDGRPLIYVVIDGGQSEAVFLKKIFGDIYTNKSYRRIYFRTKLDLSEIKDVHPTTLWLFGSFARNIVDIGDVSVAAYAALPTVSPPTKEVEFPVGLLLIKGADITQRWREWSRRTSTIVVFEGGQSDALKNRISELVAKTEARAMQMSR